MKSPWYASVVVVALASGCASASQVAGTQPPASLAAPTAMSSVNLVATAPLPPPRTALPQSPSGPASLASPPPPPSGAAPSGPPTQLGPPGGDQPGPDGQLYSKHAAQLRADALVALVQVPPGAVRQTGAMPAAVTQSSEGIGAETAQQNVWWTAPGTAATVAAFVRSHPPAGFVAGGNSGDVGEMTYDFTYPQGAKAPQTLLGISVAPDGDHVDVRAQAQVAYLPTRTAVETIPASVTSAEAVYQPPTQMLPANTTPAPRRTLTLTGSDLRLIVSAFNALDAESPVVHSCPAPNGEEAFVTATYGGHRVAFHVELNGCGGIEVTSDGVPQPELGLSDGVYSAVHTALHVTKAENPFQP